jgi:hypothetical protein
MSDFVAAARDSIPTAKTRVTTAQTRGRGRANASARGGRGRSVASERGRGTKRRASGPDDSTNSTSRGKARGGRGGTRGCTEWTRDEETRSAIPDLNENVPEEVQISQNTPQ